MTEQPAAYTIKPDPTDTRARMSLRCEVCECCRPHILADSTTPNPCNLPGEERERQLVEAIEMWECMGCGEHRVLNRTSDFYERKVREVVGHFGAQL